MDRATEVAKDGSVASRIDGPHHLFSWDDVSETLDPMILAGLDPSANLRFLQIQVQQLSGRLHRQQRDLVRRERELAARMLSWRQARWGRGAREVAAGGPESAALSRGDWSARLSWAARAGVDLERLDWAPSAHSGER